MSSVAFDKLLGKVLLHDHTPELDTRYLNLSGSNADQNIDVGSYEFSADILHATSGATGQSTIGAGLIVNNDSGSDAINDFQVNSANLTALLVDASADTMALGVPTTIGDGINYASFASDGLLSLVGTARVTRDLWIDAAGIKAPGAKPATEVAFGTLETSAWEFSNEGVEANQESVSWRIAVPYDMDRTEEVKLRVGWTSASTGNCKWQLKYRWFSEDEDMTQDGEETLTEVAAASTTANGLVVTTIEGINAPSATDATIIFKLTRLSADGEDTISDTVELHGVCFNYVSDKLGEGL